MRPIPYAVTASAATIFVVAFIAIYLSMPV
jgi:ABC-type multidrug transport system permease subunit